MAEGRGMSPLRRALALLLVLAPCASAQAATVPLDQTLSAPLKVDAGFSVGTLSTRVSYTTSTATVSGSSASVALAKGNVFKTRTCVQTHLQGKAPAVSCKEVTTDTRGLLANISIAAPTATLSTARPAAGGSGYTDALLTVSQRMTDGSFKQVATTWTSSGLGSATLSLVALDGTQAALPSLQGSELLPKAGTTEPPSGGVNTGYADSMCSTNELSGAAAPAGVSTTALGSGAPAYYEVGEPTNGGPAKGVILLLHGGGWSAVGIGGVASERTEADQWRSRGWRTINATYRACGLSGGDALWFHDRIAKLYGSSLPFCTSGQSAGGHLALIVAAFRSDVDCVVDEAGPTDAATLPNETAWDPSTGGTQDQGPRWVYNQMVAAFGQENLAWWSPTWLGVQARVLFASAAQDKFVPAAQGDDLLASQRQRDPNAYVDQLTLDPGTISWVHANVSQTALDALAAREDALVAPLVG